MNFDFDGAVRLRLGEHVVHTWDIEESLDAQATLQPDAVPFLFDNLELVVRFTAKPAGRARRCTSERPTPERELTLTQSGDGVTLNAVEGLDALRSRDPGRGLRATRLRPPGREAHARRRRPDAPRRTSSRLPGIVGRGAAHPDHRRLDPPGPLRRQAARVARGPTLRSRRLRTRRPGPSRPPVSRSSTARCRRPGPCATTPTRRSPTLGRRIDAADGYITLTSEYNHGYPASLKNAMDYVFPEFNKKPMTFVGYGNAGGARAIEQLRLVTHRVRDGTSAARRAHLPRRDASGDDRRDVHTRALRVVGRTPRHDGQRTCCGGPTR